MKNFVHCENFLSTFFFVCLLSVFFLNHFFFFCFLDLAYKRRKLTVRFKKKEIKLFHIISRFFFTFSLLINMREQKQISISCFCASEVYWWIFWIVERKRKKLTWFFAAKIIDRCWYKTDNSYCIYPISDILYWCRCRWSSIFLLLVINTASIAAVTFLVFNKCLGLSSS